MILSLIGMPGSGKSTIGFHLAGTSGLPFYDTDKVFESSVGMTVSEYFQKFGETSFRKVESEILKEMSKIGSGILATGGGVILVEENRLILRKSTNVVYLKCAPYQLYQRLKADSSRPLLRGEDLLGKLQELFNARDSLYENTAHHTFDVSFLSTDKVFEYMAHYNFQTS